MLKSRRGRIIPKDKPKSWVIMLLTFIKGLLVACPLMLAGYYLKNDTLLSLGALIYFSCWIIFAFMWIIYIAGSARGRYYNMQERDWCDQVW